MSCSTQWLEPCTAALGMVQLTLCRNYRKDLCPGAADDHDPHDCIYPLAAHTSRVRELDQVKIRG
eukprot:9466445-Pyramimonas_sp.AAC.1